MISAIDWRGKNFEFGEKSPKLWRNSNGWQKGPHEKCDFYENGEFNKDCFVGKLEHANENRGSFYL